MSLAVSHDVSTAAVASSPTVKRGQYDEIVSLVGEDGSALRPSTVIALFKSVLPEKFVEFDKKKRGDALNIDLYGYDEEQEVAVVQIRHFFRRYKNGFGNTHKSYVLVGRNDESREYFRHPVSSGAVRAGIRKDPSNPVAAVRAAQRWMWSVTDKQLAAGIRQGDVLLVPVRGKPSGATAIEERVVVVGRTHEVSARAFAQDAKGTVYAEAPTIRHTKNQHSAVYGDGDGWHAVKVAQEADVWDWGVRLGD